MSLLLSKDESDNKGITELVRAEANQVRSFKAVKWSAFTVARSIFSEAKRKLLIKSLIFVCGVALFSGLIVGVLYACNVVAIGSNMSRQGI